VVTVELRGLELHGRHGVLPEERERGQRFLVDVELRVPERAAETDRLEDAVDYRAVATTVREISDGHAYSLLEALAAAVADALLERFPVERVRVRVGKPDVVLEPPAELATVSVVREREPGPSSR
jgi:7,8-dihydroneopterin aldolase/epimerase/oxygenase